MAQLLAASSSVYSVSPCTIPRATPCSAPSPVVLHGFGQACKWTAGAPAAHAAHVLFMSRGRRDAPRHTPCQKHTLPLCTQASYHAPPPNPLPTQLKPVTFSLHEPLCPCPRKVITVKAGRDGGKHSNAIPCNVPLAASPRHSITHTNAA